MSETLDVLIKIAERKVEEVQRALAQTREEIGKRQEEQVRLEREAAVAFVTAVAEEDVLAMQAAGAFQERMRREVFKLKQEEQALVVLEGQQRQELQVLFAGQKKYELLQERQKLAARKERMKKAQNNLDEVAGRKR
jgi:flagellar export protein FliJ